MAASLPTSGCVRLPGLNSAGDIGPWLIGTVVASALWGVLLVLVAIYLRTSKSDRIGHRIIVALLTLLSTANWALDLRLLWYYAVEARDSDIALIGGPVLVTAVEAIVAFSAVLSQLVFGYRAYIITSRNKIIGAILVILIAGSLAVGIVAIVQDVIAAPHGPIISNGGDLRFYPDFARPLFFKNVTFSEAFLWVTAGVDVFISAVLVAKLAKDLKGSSGFSPGTDSVVKAILRLCVSSAAITSGVAIAMAVLDVEFTSRDNGNNAVWGMAVLQSHVNAIIVVGSLNLRRSLNNQQQSASYPSQGRSLSKTASRSGPSNGLSSRSSRPAFNEGVLLQMYHETSVDVAPNQRARYPLVKSTSPPSPHERYDPEAGFTEKGHVDY